MPLDSKSDPQYSRWWSVRSTSAPLPERPCGPRRIAQLGKPPHLDGWMPEFRLVLNDGEAYAEVTSVGESSSWTWPNG